MKLLWLICKKTIVYLKKTFYANFQLKVSKELNELWSFVDLAFQMILLQYIEEFDTVFIQKILM